MTSTIKVDTIEEKTSANGVAIDSVTLKDGAVTATAASTITVADNSDNLTLTSTDADANVGPNLRLYRNSSSPADSDILGQIDFEGRNDNSQDYIAAQIKTATGDVSDGTEDAQIEFDVMTGGTLTEYMRMSSGSTPSVIFNEGSADIDFRVESNGNANAIFVESGTDRVGIFTASPTVALDVTGDVKISGDLTVTGDDIVMGTNTSGHIMVADGTNFNPVAVSGDVSIAANGAVTIASTAVETSMIAADAITEAKIADNAVESEHINDNVISGQSALTSGLATTDELLISDGGTIKKMDVSVLTVLTDSSATALAIALG